MASFNRIILVGNLTRDPDYKVIASGQAVCRLSIAVNRQFKNKQSGTLVQEVCFVDVDVWGLQAESCRQYLQKGRPVLVEGRLKYDSWEDPNGQTRSRHTVVADRVVFLSSQGTQLDVEEGVRSALPDASPTDETVMQLNPNDPVERDLLQQLEQTKSKIQAAARGHAKEASESSAKKSAVSTGEVDFKDEPPFEDQLPF
jgi:single-strand DNA-binding protein